MLNWLKKPIYYPYHWKNVLALSVVFGCFQVFIIIFLEPHGTGDYIDEYKYFKLSGYALCYVIPFIIIYYTEKITQKKLFSKWKVWLEIVFKLILILLIITASYFYNITVINDISPSFYRWVEYITIFSLPNIFVFLPLVWLMYYYLFKKKRRNTIILRGKNTEDNLHLHEDAFIYAISDKNYVEIFYKTSTKVKSLRMRITLKELHKQIPGGARVHKSYLVNLNYVERIIGRKKNRFVIINYVEKPIPVSRNYEVSNLIRY